MYISEILFENPAHFKNSPYPGEINASKVVSEQEGEGTRLFI